MSDVSVPHYGRECIYVNGIHRVRKKRVWSISGITSSNTDRFLKFFHYYNLLKICNKAVVKYPTTPQTRHYTTLWNIDVRKLACPVRCGSLTERRTRQNPDVLLAAAAAFLNENCLLSLLLLKVSLYQFSIMFVIISRRFFCNL